MCGRQNPDEPCRGSRVPALTGHIDAPVRIAGEADAEHVYLTVADHGSGIDPAFLATLFEPFTQADGRTGRETGLGLGLHIVRGLVEAMHGTIEARSRLG